MRYDLADLGTTFSTRALGSDVRQEIETLVAQTGRDEPVLIDFADVHLISFSFADEFVGILLSERAAGNLGDRAVLLANANEDVLVPIERSLERRGLIAGHLVDGHLDLVNAPTHLGDTLDALFARG